MYVQRGRYMANMRTLNAVMGSHQDLCRWRRFGRRAQTKRIGYFLSLPSRYTLFFLVPARYEEKKNPCVLASPE